MRGAGRLKFCWVGKSPFAPSCVTHNIIYCYDICVWSVCESVTEWESVCVTDYVSERASE